VDPAESRENFTVMPDYVDNLLSRTERMSQRPGWTFPERWFPMSTITATLSARRPASLRPLIVLAIVAALIAGALLVYVVGSLNRVPPPFGVARNGLIVTSSGGSILTLDPVTGTRSTLIEGEHLCCVSPSPNGRLVSYLDLQFGGDNPAALRVASLDGKPVAEIPATFLHGLYWGEWSTTSDRIISVSYDGVSILDVATGQTSVFDLVVPFPILRISWIGASDDLLISAQPRVTPTESVPMHVYRWIAATDTLTEIAVLENAVEAPAISPDGSKFAYFIWGAEDRVHGRVHVVDLATGINTAITPEDEASNADPHSVEGVVWSPDSSSIASYWLWTGYDQLGVLSATGGEPVFIGPKEPQGFGEGGKTRFSPDGKTVLVQYGNQSTTLLIPVSGEQARQVSWALQEDIDWQRLAP
jgi:Tol biopolymer transport system component